MKTLRSTLVAAFAMLSIGLAAHGQATRTWVSGVGDDANPCSRTAPCKTFPGAISKTAVGGEIDNLDTGGFGAVTITKSITLDGGGGQLGSILVSGTPGITINAPGSVVILRNLSIQGIGNSSNPGTYGINVVAASAVYIQHCAILSFGNDGININLGTGAQIFVEDTTSQNNAGNGINIVGTASGVSGEVRVNISESHFSGNAIGVFAGDTSRVAVRTSDANGNTGAGFEVLANTYSATMSIADSVAANNLGAGILAGGGTAASTIRASNVSLFSNTAGFQTSTMGSIQSFGNNHNPGAGAPTSTITAQ